jgi:hypothetical protein
VAATQTIQESASVLLRTLDGLGFCLSEDGDLLSQWRGYAADAAGVSIGFSKDYLEHFARTNQGQEKSGFFFQRVEYAPEIQGTLIEPAYRRIKDLLTEGAFVREKGSILAPRKDDDPRRDQEKLRDVISRLAMSMITILKNMFVLKNSAFREEREWRLISYFLYGESDKCSFRALNNRIVPYRDFELLESGNGSIMELIIGPKNTTPNYVIESFLKQRGFANVTVSRSKATYR